MSNAFGAGWLERVIRGRFRVAGPQPYPEDLEKNAQISMEARPSLPWEWGNALWIPVVAAATQGAGGAGTFAVCDISVVAVAQRALVLRRVNINTSVGSSVGLYLNRAFVAPAIGGALIDGRLIAAGPSWFTPVADFGLAVSTPAALPAVATRAWDTLTPAGVPVDFDNEVIIMPGQTVSFFNETANQNLIVNVAGYLVPVADMG